MKKGVLIIAVGHKNYLGMALNLAASIRVNDPGLQIALATDVPAPGEYQGKLFDCQVQVTPEMITHRDEPAYIKSKLFMLELSPFDQTIFLDADQVMIPNRSLLPIFEEMQNVDVTMSNTGPLKEPCFWAENQEITERYGDGELWSLHSEFVYFKKTAAAKKYFKAAQKVFKENKLKTAIKFGGAPMADELAFICACVITATFPHQAKWMPNFWFAREPINRNKYPYQLTNFVTYSMGGNNAPRSVKTNYQNVVLFCFQKLGLRVPYVFIDKREFITNRKNV